MSDKKEILFVNVGIQNGEYSLDEKPYKMTGILAAQVLNHLQGNPEVVHTWNTVGNFNDQALTSPEERLEQKYSSVFMREHLTRWDTSNTPDILRDDDPAFAHFSLECLELALSKNNRLYITDEEFTRCQECQQTIAEKNVTVDSCPGCHSTSTLTTTVEAALFVDLPEDRLSLLPYERQYNKVNLKHELSTLRNVPHRLLLSRDRSSGAALDILGLPGKKLDPRLGIGLLAIYAASLYGYQEAGLTQSTSTLIRTVPYLSSVVNDADSLGIPDYRYAFHSKISPDLMKPGDIQPELLAFQSLCQRNNVTRSTVQNLLLQTKSMTKRLHQLRRKYDDHDIHFDEIIPEVKNGNLTDIFATTNKALGRAIELSKDKNTEPKLIMQAIRFGEIIAKFSRDMS